MKTNKLEIKGNNLIGERNKITSEIGRFWNIIATENIVKKGTMRNYDLKQLLTRIKALYDQSIIVKLRIQCANMGMKIKDLPRNANIINIYKLSAYNEYFVKLDEMMRKHTINPSIKQKKGKKALSVTEELTYSYLKNLRDKIAIELNTLRKDIAKFNDCEDLSDDSIPLFLVA